MNRHTAAVSLQLPGPSPQQPPETRQLRPGEVWPLRSIGPAPIAYQSEVGLVRVTLAANSVYAFDVTSDSRLLLNIVDLGGDEETARGSGVAAPKSLLQAVEIPVKLLVDDEQQAAQRIWEERLRKRVAAASAILEQCCLVRLKVVEVGTWESEDGQTDLAAALGEFARQVNPQPARLALGFSSQFALTPESASAGQSTGLLRGHILLRDASTTATEVELVEVLVHELGHVLGAVNSNIPWSVMRPTPLDGQARKADFAIRFDPVNLLLTNLVAEEIRLRDVKTLAEMQPATRTRLKQVYTRLGYAPAPAPEKPEPEPAAVAANNPPAKTAAPPRPAEKTEPTPPEKKPVAKRTEAHPDLALLQGKWKVVSAKRRGAAVPEALKYVPTLEEDKLTLQAKDLGTFRFKMEIDPENVAEELKQGEPLPFNLTLEIQGKQMTTKGIYFYDGTELRVSIARPGHARPTTFSPPADRDEALLVFRRGE